MDKSFAGAVPAAQPCRLRRDARACGSGKAGAGRMAIIWSAYRG